MDAVETLVKNVVVANSIRAEQGVHHHDSTPAIAVDHVIKFRVAGTANGVVMRTVVKRDSMLRVRDRHGQGCPEPVLLDKIACG